MRPHRVPDLQPEQKRFLGRLKSVLTDKYEKYIDNGIDLICEPGSLKLELGNRKIAAYSERECKVNDNEEDLQIVYTVVENKRRDIAKTEIQLAACMIAAMQHNSYNYTQEYLKCLNNEFISSIFAQKVTILFYHQCQWLYSILLS
jgi:hypothetical protein